MTAFLALIPRWVLYAVVVALAGVSITLTVVLADAKMNLAQSTVEKAGLQVMLADAKTKAAERETELADARTQVAEQATELSNQIIEAQNEARKREALLRAAAVAAADESNGLRNDLSAMHDQLAKLSRDAIVERNAALGSVLAECADRYKSMAEKADRHATDVKMLVDAWPK